MNSILFIVTDAQTFSGTTVSAFDLIMHRISNGLWPIFRSTPLQKEFSENTEFWVYAGGKGNLNRTICARFKISDIVSWSFRDRLIDPENILIDSPTLCLKIYDHKIISPPVHILDVVEKMSLFEKNTKMWWIFLQGGARRLSSGDAGILETISNTSLS